MEDVSRLAEASAPRESSSAAERARATFASTSGRDDRGDARGEKRPRTTGRRRREDEWSRDRRARRLATALAPRLGVGSAEHARDVLVSMVLCECAAKSSTEEARAKIAELQADLPPGVVAVRGARLSGDHVAHRYLVADGPGAVYLAFAGTQDARDLLTDAAYLQTPLRVRSSASSTPRLMVHRGFAARARATRASVAAAWRAARALGKRLVLCGHSLGGAVAALAALTLLLELDHLDRDDHGAPRPGDTLLCAAFAAPPVGDESTRRYVERRGWTRAFINVCAPEDAVPRLLLTPGRRAAETTRADVDDDDDEARAARDPSGFVAAALSAGRSLRPEYAHWGPPRRLLRGGRVVLGEDDDEPTGSASLRRALIRHTMRAYRARVCEVCANAFPDPRDRSGAAWREPARNGDVDADAASRRRFEPSRWFDPPARSVVGRILALPTPVGDATVVPAPRPLAAAAATEPSGGVLAVVAGEDLDLCGRVTADVRGWPCVASVSSSSPTRAIVRVSPPTFNGRALPAEDAGGADPEGWRPMVLALEGDFGHARVAVRVVDERVDAETLGTALDAEMASRGDEGAGGVLRRWFGGVVRSRL